MIMPIKMSCQASALYEIVPRVKQRIIDSFTPEAHDIFIREFRFFDKVTSISGVLYPLPKEERRAGIRRYFSNLSPISRQFLNNYS